MEEIRFYKHCESRVASLLCWVVQLCHLRPGRDLKLNKSYQSVAGAVGTLCSCGGLGPKRTGVSLLVEPSRLPSHTLDHFQEVMHITCTLLHSSLSSHKWLASFCLIFFLSFGRCGWCSVEAVAKQRHVNTVRKQSRACIQLVLL